MIVWSHDTILDGPHEMVVRDLGSISINDKALK